MKGCLEKINIEILNQKNQRALAIWLSSTFKLLPAHCKLTTRKANA